MYIYRSVIQCATLMTHGVEPCLARLAWPFRATKRNGGRVQGERVMPGNNESRSGQRASREDSPMRRAGNPRRRRDRAETAEYEIRGTRRHERRGTRMPRLPREEPARRFPQRGRGHTPDDSFRCGHCKRFIGPLPSGGHHRNHCPFCLYSRHVDATRSGDRASTCKALMQPIGTFQRRNGEHVIVHRCLGCGFERFNRIAADDDFELVLSLPALPPRSANASSPENPAPSKPEQL